jgi:hypothetical protein
MTREIEHPDGVQGAYRIGDWQGAGGYDATTMLYGKWVGQTEGTTPSDSYWSMLWSHYAYRCVPFASNRPWCAAYEGPGTVTAGSACDTSNCRPQLAFTKPGINPRWGAPAFRTQKDLGQRALVSDTFSKGVNKDALGKAVTYNTTIANTQLLAGYGIVCHRDGYNVLYGDSSAKWYGDPQQQIIWHGQGFGAIGTPYNTDNLYFLLGNNLFQGTNSGGVPFTNEWGVSDASGGGWRYSSAKIWHDFDAATGVDSF